jgi:ionotropic glutamate receptor
LFNPHKAQFFHGLDLITCVKQIYDAMVGDTTIVMDRSLYVDFTLPYTESGVQMVVPMKENWSKSFWIFVKPIENVLWAAILVVFVSTGFVVWLVEHKRNRQFGGNAAQQFFNISYFSFQAIIATPRGEKKKVPQKNMLISPYEYE